MLRRIPESSLLPDSHPILDVGQRLYTTDVANLGLSIVSKQGGKFRQGADDILRVEKPNRDPLFVLIKNAIEESVWRPAYDILRTVSGSLANRPDVIGQQLRLPQFKKNGELGNYNAASPAITDAFGGNADLLGYYRYKNPAPGRVDCAPTAWTTGKANVLLGCVEFIRKVDEVYRTFLEPEYARQMDVVKKVPQNWRLFDTAFTTLYVLKNAPTAVHKDTADAFGTFGCMASLGDFEGNELVFPKYRIGVDYRPGDVILADVHEFHTNLPLLSGERVSCVFFVREGMDACPVGNVSSTATPII
jgi:hypothetical protein